MAYRFHSGSENVQFHTLISHCLSEKGSVILGP